MIRRKTNQLTSFTLPHMCPQKKLATTTHQRYYSRICICSFSAGLRTLILPSRPLHMRRKARKDGSLLYPLTRMLCLCPWRESNPHLTLRTGLLYPLSYKGPVALADRATGTTSLLYDGNQENATPTRAPGEIFSGFSDIP